MKRLIFRLYVAGDSGNSLLAIANLKQFCETLLKGSYEIDIIDVLARPKLALSAGILVTPTLELPSAGERRRLVGTLANLRSLQSIIEQELAS